MKKLNEIYFRLMAASSILLMPVMALADRADGTFTSSTGGACKFVNNIQTVLNLISVSVVTIAIIFAGYQIAFAHNRISDVAPVLIGGVLIGAAGQIAKMLVETGSSCGGAVSSISQFINFIA